jgi:hypothetical protein
VLKKHVVFTHRTALNVLCISIDCGRNYIRKNASKYIGSKIQCLHQSDYADYLHII